MLGKSRSAEAADYAALHLNAGGQSFFFFFSYLYLSADMHLYGILLISFHCVHLSLK